LQHPPAAVPRPANHPGLLDRLDGLVELAAERHGLALLPDGALAAAEQRAAAHAAALRPASDDDLGALGLLRALGEAVGLLRARGGRLEATALRPAWGRVDPDLRAGLVYAAWCHRVPWPRYLGGTPAATALAAGRAQVLRLLLELPAGVEVDLAELAARVAASLGVGPAEPAAEPAAGPGEWLAPTLAAALLEPLAALGVAELLPRPPRPPARLRLDARARTAVGSALVAAGEQVPIATGSAG
jgi:hypothetical protein